MVKPLADIQNLLRILLTIKSLQYCQPEFVQSENQRLSGRISINRRRAGFAGTYADGNPVKTKI